jgi:hypothetical protein
MSKLTEQTTVSLSLFGMVLASLVGAILWASSVAAKADLALEKADKIEKMAIDLAEIKNDIQWIKRNLNK